MTRSYIEADPETYTHSTGVSGDSLITALFEGYGHGAGKDNPGNFLNPGDPGYNAESVKQTVAGQLDIQGHAGNTQEMAANIVSTAQANGTDTKTLLQNLAGLDASVIQEGTYQDKNYGHTYLMAVADPKYAADHGIDVSGANVSDLYDKGLMRSGSTDDIEYWEADKQGSIADIAANFLKTSESQTHQAFDANFGRMAGAEGLDYFAGINTSDYSDSTSGEESNIADNQTLSDYIGNIIGYTGGTFNPETGRDWDVSAETIAREASYTLGGEASKASDKNSLYYTAPKEADINRYRDSIRDARKLDEGTDTNIHGAAAEKAVKDEIFNKADQLLGANQGDFDDLGGIAAGNATGMGRFLSDDEQQTGFNEGKTGDDWYDETKGTVWGALKGEVDKTTVPRGAVDEGFDTEVWLEEQAKKEGKEFNINDYRMWNQKYLDEGGGGYDPNDWTLDPKKPDPYTNLPVNREKVDYMPHLTSDVQLPGDVKYGDRAKDFQTEYNSVPGTAQTAQGQAGQRFTGTSAKGVRMKRSKASRMGTIRGTKQLGREQQTKSLNI